MGKSGKVLTAAEAVALIEDGATLAVSCSSGLNLPDSTLAALGRRHQETGHPRGVTLFFPIAPGDMYGQAGIDHLTHPGLLRRLIGGSYPSGPSSVAPPRIYGLIESGQVEAYNFPSGVLMHLLREIAGRRPGVLTEVGLGTCADPRAGGGRMSPHTPAGVVEVVHFDGREWLFYRAFPVHAAIVRATTADEDGNLTFEHEGGILAAPYVALATHNSGGRVIAQVKRLAARGTLHPHAVRVPGTLVDAIVVDPHQQQATQTTYDPAISGEVRLPLSTLAPIPFGPEKVIARRLTRELAGLPGGAPVVLGFGISALVPRVLLEEGRLDDVTFCIEQGATGGVPVLDFAFGCAYNPQAIMESPFQFDFFQGGGCALGLLSFLEVDGAGSVNVSLLPSRPHVTAGIGGFMDITTHGRRLVFAGFFRAGGLKVAVEDGRMRILEEGRHPKFVARVQHVTFNGRLAQERDQEVTFVTERGVLRPAPDGEGLVLIEVAPGIDPERDVVAQAGCRVQVAPNLRELDASLFRP